MLMINATVGDVIFICLTSLVGMYFIGMAIVGYWKVKLCWIQRIIAAAGGLCMIVPGLATDLVGLVLCAGVVIYQVRLEKKNA